MFSTFASVIKPKGLCLQSIQQTPTSWTRNIDRSGVLSSFIRHQSFATTRQQIKKATTDTNAQRPRQVRWEEETREMSKLILKGMTSEYIHIRFPHQSPDTIQKKRLEIQRAMEMPFVHPMQRWTIEEKEKLHGFIQQGMALKEIKDQFPDRTFYSVHGQIRRIKIDPDWARDPMIFDWTAKEDEQMRKLMDDGISPLTCYQRFPGRSLGSVRRRMARKRRLQDTVALLQEQQEQQKQRQQLLKKSHGVQSMTKLILGDKRHEGKQIALCSIQLTSHSRRMRLWTPEEDETLKKFAASHKDLSELWSKIQKAYISNGKVNGVKFIRTGLSSKKRLEQLKNDSRRRAGPWDVDEIKRLEQAIQEQIGDKPQVIADVRHDVGTISVETAGQDKPPRLKAGQGKPRKLNWCEVAEQVGSRDRIQCRTYMYRNFHRLQVSAGTR